MEHFRPHNSPRPRFEGYYSKFTLPSSAHLVLIICSVPKATTRPHMVSFTYVPPDFPKVPYFQRELWADDIEMLDLREKSSSSSTTTTTTATNTNDENDDGITTPKPADPEFEIRVSNIGYMRVYSDHATEYSIDDPSGSFTFKAHVPGGAQNRTPFVCDDPHSTPEGWLVNLPLPLHWHVHTLASRCSFSLSISESVYTDTNPLDLDQSPSPSPSPSLPNTKLNATVHQEKNWAHSFPTTHIWIRASSSSSSPSPSHPQTHLSIAGGITLHTRAYLVTYHARNPRNSIHFTPPYTSTLPFLPHNSITWTTRTISLTFTSLQRRISVTATAPKGTFIGMSAPFEDGHRLNYLGESFCGKVEVVVYAATRWGWGHWEEVEREGFEGAAVEFGGGWYGERGGDSWVN